MKKGFSNFQFSMRATTTVRPCNLLVALCLLAFVACDNKQSGSEVVEDSRIDSLQQIVNQKDNEINDIMGTLNDIQEGFRLINEAEGRISVTQDGEGINQSQQIKENIVYISQRLAENRELIRKLRAKLKESTVQGEELNRTIEGLIAQLEQKDQELQKLREELDAKDIHISELDETIAGLKADVSDLKADNASKDATISEQDTELNTAWYAFGTKKELKEQNVLRSGKVQVDNLSKGYFTKIDIRKTKEIKLYSKSAQLLTVHPSGSYTLKTDANGQYILTVTNTEQFWSTSKYLVIQVK